MNTKHLKAKILDLAIRGKLVPQDPSEGNAADLLKMIREEKGGESLPLATAGKPSFATPSAGSNAARNARSKNTSFIIKADDGKHYEHFPDGSLKDIEEEIPFEIPENWCWCRFCNCSINRDGERKPVSEKIRKKLEKKYDYIGATGPVDKINNFLFNETLLLVGEDGANLLSKNKDNAFIVTGKYWVNNHAHVIDATDKNLLQFYKIYLNAIRLDDYVTGSAQPKFTQDALNNLLIPLPPLSEQKRIVFAIEKAFEQIDIIEKNKDNLKNYIKQTKNKVLDLAIHGKLVEQNPQEGNAADLLQKIREEKNSSNSELDSGANKKIKADKNASFIIKADDGKHYEQFSDGSLKDIEEEIPFEIPNNWCWCRLQEVCELKGGKRIPAGLSATKEKTNHIYIRVSDMKNETISDSDLVYISDYIYEKIKQYTISKDDLYLTIAGTIGRVGEVPPLFDKMNLTENALRLTNIKISKRLLMIFLKTPFIQDYFFSSFHQVAMPKLSMTTSSKTLIPLPPLAEQKRIVEKIEEIFKQLEILEKAIGE